MRSSFWPGVRPEFFPVFEKNAQNAKRTFEMLKWQVIVWCLMLDWYHWMSVHAINFYFYVWLLKILWLENTSSHVSRHLEFIIKQGQWVTGSTGSPGRWITGSQSSSLLSTCRIGGLSAYACIPHKSSENWTENLTNTNLQVTFSGHRLDLWILDWPIAQNWSKFQQKSKKASIGSRIEWPKCMLAAYCINVRKKMGQTYTRRLFYAFRYGRDQHS